MTVDFYAKCLLRLTDLERQKLQLVVAALKVSEYTDDVDDFRRPHSREKRMVASLLELFDTITGLAIASDAVPKSTKDALLAGDTNISAVVPLLEELFEILRRHKRLNPFDNRSEYGKLVMLLQDVQRDAVRRALGITSTLITPLKTVGDALSTIGASGLLTDDKLKAGFLRLTGQDKLNGLSTLVDTYGGKDDPKKREIVERCLRSIDDVRQFLLSNIDPLIYLREKVEREFAHMKEGDPYSVAIRGGKGGARFSHSNSVHCQYVAESLLLWEKVQRTIFVIWEAAENDMLIDGGGRYEITNTGQGFHRLCSAPKSFRAMSRCVSETEREMGGWVGIKVIHLGDVDVPNPLVFIDKYTIIPRIVQPVMHTVRALRHAFEEESAAADGEPTYPGLRNLLRAKYHSYEELRLMILSDFFKHAFDGSGDDGGSCIDGRLTSAWNWCHQLHKKPYYDAFVLTGFNGFD